MSAAGVGSSVLTASTPLTAILAIGSNAGPSQLARKFPLELFPEGVVVPVSVSWGLLWHVNGLLSGTASDLTPHVTKLSDLFSGTESDTSRQGLTGTIRSGTESDLMPGTESDHKVRD